MQHSNKTPEKFFPLVEMSAYDKEGLLKSGLVFENDGVLMTHNQSEARKGLNEIQEVGHRKLKEIIEFLKKASKEKCISEETIVIPDDCEKYGFVEGEFSLVKMLGFLGAMLE